ncbi:glycoside hydrolase family 97 protein [Flavihumibacter petaseus]|uniref:Putative alpha-galactosidase n=1 Tax=Flavihumibacter petaseus NBRC 106054 TaxID=1220578 RepID=A0A0E9N590_9BACT|nr:glycoside hydrolase family 97 protein [Flavihumibacter petaseus]GAO44510.1 putative alpha-galactosidase [Flavihumibacter petaseus NBRC 106054]
MFYPLRFAILVMGLVIAPKLQAATDSLKLAAPSGNIRVKIWQEKQLHFTVWYREQVILQKGTVDIMPVDKPALSASGPWRRVENHEVKDTIVSPVPEKRIRIPDHYRQLILNFRSGYKVVFRAYDDGVAYRIISGFADSMVIRQETAIFSFPGKPVTILPLLPESAADRFQQSFEDTYSVVGLDTLASTALTYSPVMIRNAGLPTIVLTESDLEHYPGMFLTRGNAPADPLSLQAVFAAYPEKVIIDSGEFSQKKVTARTGFLARTTGSNSFPWRIMAIAVDEKELPGNDIVYRLASPSRLTETSWIRPGNITDEWIIDLNLYHLPFKAGRNTETYKYYVDFAARFGIDRVMLDAGWSDNNDLFKVIPQINMDSLTAYAREKGVKIALWTLALTLDRQLDSILPVFRKWGVDFIMTDFINRDDQVAVDFHHRIAKACAGQKIMIMFHGSFPPKGFNRTWPNAVAREGVLGSEYNIWSDRVTPEHDTWLPFVRMVAGPLDYEPGLLNNASRKSFRAIEGFVMSAGTRCHQLAMYGVYDSPIQFFVGNPSQAITEPAFMELLGEIPTLWDETRILAGRAGEHLVTARRKGNTWYVAGITNWSPRIFVLEGDFLEAGNYQATICRDGLNAEKYPADYSIGRQAFSNTSRLELAMAAGGGFLVKIEKLAD